jgi:hypothetical protein
MEKFEEKGILGNLKGKLATAAKIGVLSAASIAAMGCDDKSSAENVKKNESPQGQQQVDDWTQRKSDEIDRKLNEHKSDSEKIKELARAQGINFNDNSKITYETRGGVITKASVDGQSLKIEHTPDEIKLINLASELNLPIKQKSPENVSPSSNETEKTTDTPQSEIKTNPDAGDFLKQ